MMSAEDEEDMKAAGKWLRDIAIDLGDGVRIEIDKLQRYLLLKLIFRSSQYELKEKRKLLDRERSIEFGDVDDIENYGVQASIPD